MNKRSSQRRSSQQRRASQAKPLNSANALQLETHPYLSALQQALSVFEAEHCEITDERYDVAVHVDVSSEGDSVCATDDDCG